NFSFSGLCVLASSEIRRLFFVNFELTWSEARSYCRENHTDLVTVQSQNETEHLLNMTQYSVNDAVWIGLYRDSVISNWASLLYCASINSQGEWEDQFCSQKKAFMCYTETSNITERYTLIEELKSWTEAQQYCREHHTDLGDNYTFHNWSNGQPDDYQGKEKCVVMLKDGKWADIDCKSHRSFICFDGLCVLASSEIRRLFFVNFELTWSEARSYCRENHTDLVTVQSQNETEHLLNITRYSVNDAVWIGLYRDSVISNWASLLYCASINSQGEWEDQFCSQKKAFMCYTETSNITERYTLIEELKSWTEAQQYCREHHTDLVSINSDSENEDLVKKAQGKTFWIGLFNNLWKWSHQGDNYTFHNWSNGQPDDYQGKEKCVVMLKDGKWADIDCKSHRSFICFDVTPVPEELHLISDSMVWPEAWQYCRDHYTDLLHDNVSESPHGAYVKYLHFSYIFRTFSSAYISGVFAEELQVYQEPEVNVTVGERTRLGCAFNTSSGQVGIGSFKWYRVQSDGKRSEVSNETHPAGVVTSDQFRTNKDASLFLLHPHTYDSGLYYCEVELLSAGRRTVNGTVLAVYPRSKVTHRLDYLFTATTKNSGLPSVVAVAIIDGVQIEYYDSNTKEVILRQDWIENVLEPEAWTTHVEDAIEQHYKMERALKGTMMQFNHTKVPPEVRLLQKKAGHSAGSGVTCHVTGFYPREVEVTWLRDGQGTLEEGVWSGEVLPNMDGTYQVRKTLTVSPEEQERHRYTCQVDHASLGEKIEKE
ncbi:UNVERIFIED_CONTAM: hypothetical protein FKN15_036090, partial [Acipenser sinensis]